MIDPSTLRELFAGGLSYPEMATHLGVSRATLLRALRCEGLSRPRGPRKGEGGRVATLTRSVLLSASLEHATKTAAAKALGVTPAGLRRALAREGVEWKK